MAELLYILLLTMLVGVVTLLGGLVVIMLDFYFRVYIKDRYENKKGEKL